MADPKSTKLVQDSLAAGFRGGWYAALETIAADLEGALSKLRKDSEGDYSVDVKDVIAMAHGMAKKPPTPGIVEMTQGEKLEEVKGRAVMPPAPPVTIGPVPSAQEAFAHVAGILSAFPPGADRRRGYAQWIAVIGFALFSRDCAAMDGVLPDIDREAGRLRDLIVGDQPIPRARPLGPEAQA